MMSHSSGKSKLSFPKFNLKDERGNKQACQLCNNPFSVFKMQHLCKRCLRSVCADCSPYKVKTYRSDKTIRLHRNCNICNVESTKIKEYIEHNKLSFGKDSDLLYVWQKVIFQRKGVKLKRSKSCLTRYVDLLNLWESLNFSFREFIGRVIEKGNVSDAELTNMINNGFEEIENSSFCNNFQGALYIYLFFLCHCDVENSVNLSIHLLELLSKQSDKKNIAKIVKNIGFSEIQSYKMKEFIQENQILLKESASINLMPITISLEIVNYTITKATSAVIMIGCITAFAKRKQSTLKNLQKIYMILYDLLRNPPNVNLIEHLGIINDDLTEKYTELQTSYKFLKEKYEKLENELQNSKNQSKRMQSQQSLTSIDNTLCESNLHFSNEQFGKILIFKNQQIMKQKMKIEEIRILCNIQKRRLQELQQKTTTLTADLKQKTQQADKLKQQNTHLSKTNAMLIEKMKDLSKLLMDKQQKQIDKNANLFLELQELQNIDVKKEECIIY